MKAIVTGSFDPMTLGHCELVRLACEKFDTVYVVALVNANKKHMFTLEERKEIIELSTSDFHNVVADAYDGLTVDYMHKNGITQIVRGIKNESELEYEKNIFYPASSPRFIVSSHCRRSCSSYLRRRYPCSAQYSRVYGKRRSSCNRKRNV